MDGTSPPAFRALLQEMDARFGCPVVLNTSFNLRGQPIVRTPLEAVATYARSALDALAIGDWLVQREPAAAGNEGSDD